MHFDYTAMVTNGAFDSLLDDLANQKALSLAIRLVSEDIVKKLSAANGADYVDAGITVTDFVRKMFLDSGKSVEVGPLSTAILDSFERTVSERTEAVSEALLNKSNETTGRLMGMLMEQEAEIKAEFSLFNAFTNLNDDLTASIELISEHVALEESKVSSRFTRTLVNTDLYDVKRPIGTPSLIERYENDKFQQLWAELTEGAL
uniref:Uncharacterized protein n=1 Tax=Favella ehrenbergii TaxID=182087 RepID=A0A7S3HYH6_9SPIT|mmetsp:Transcript_10018/g.13629  ORF Transcript_10018/g.13629 Transcript_10018/m.13629 type:complete len:204 (+) Transcript_10018:1614-2225(+)